MKGILMTPDNAQMCHTREKTQTRRLIKLDPPVNEFSREWSCPFTNDGTTFVFTAGFGLSTRQLRVKCPYSIGEHVYIKETFAQFSHRHVSNHNLHYPIHTHMPSYQDAIVIYRGSGADFPEHFYRDKMAKWKPSIHMPAWAARTIVEITDIRAQRVQDISEKDAEAEGVADNIKYKIAATVHIASRKFSFMKLWDSIHGEGAWERNDWVWAYSFKKAI